MLENSMAMGANGSESNLGGPSQAQAQLTCETNLKSARPSPPSPSSPFPKRSRRSVQKRVVSIPIQEAEGSRAKGASECAPPSDSWAWRKYGQKPIKGSPYPRGYYRCSSSKGCPARKQVERSRVDPTMLVVSYTCEHNHPWPLPKSNHQHNSKHVQAVKVEAEADPDPDRTTQSPSESSPGTAAADPDPVPEESSRFSDLIGEESTALMITPDDFWYSDVGSTSSTSPPSDTLLYGPIFVGSAELAPDECENIGDFKNDEDDALFAGLGELPEYSTVFRRSHLERQMVLHTAVHQ